MCHTVVDVFRGLVESAQTVAERRFVYCLVSSHGIWRRFRRDETAATAIEYGLIIGGISIAILATVFAIGTELDSMFTFIASKLRENMGNFGS
jgi:pilus assembly protein Flp/PilA